MAKVITNGAAIEPICANASIVPAPIEWIYKGKDSV